MQQYSFEELSQLRSDLENFYGAGDILVIPMAGGTNNLSFIVTMGDVKYALRLYVAHQNMELVAFEHGVLRSLQGKTPGFSIPRPIENHRGETIFKTSQGRLGSLFLYIEGKTPAHMEGKGFYNLGCTLGRLSVALETVSLMPTGGYGPCYDLFLNYPDIENQGFMTQLEKVYKEMGQPVKDIVILQKQFEMLKENIPNIRKLPHQLVHGDINFSNILLDGQENIHGVLDFEFVTLDVRIMELATCCADLISYTEGFQGKEYAHLLQGFKSVVSVTPEEEALLPHLIILRRVDTLLHFLYRYLHGHSGRELVVDQVKRAVSLCCWLDAQGIGTK